MKPRRVGIFAIRRDILNERPAELIELFHALKILVVRAEMQYAQDAIEYTGIGPCFDEIEPMYVIPMYTITAETNPDTPGTYRYRVEKCEGDRSPFQSLWQSK